MGAPAVAMLRGRHAIQVKEATGNPPIPAGPTTMEQASSRARGSVELRRRMNGVNRTTARRNKKHGEARPRIPTEATTRHRESRALIGVRIHTCRANTIRAAGITAKIGAERMAATLWDGTTNGLRMTRENLFQEAMSCLAPGLRLLRLPQHGETCLLQLTRVVG